MADSQAVLSYLNRRQTALNRNAIRRAALRTIIGCSIVWFDTFLSSPLLHYVSEIEAQQIVDLLGVLVIIEGAFRLLVALYYYLYVPSEVGSLNAEQRRLLHVPTEVKASSKPYYRKSVAKHSSLFQSPAPKEAEWRKKLSSPEGSIFSPAKRILARNQNYCVGSLSTTVVTPPYNSVMTSPSGKSYHGNTSYIPSTPTSPVRNASFRQDSLGASMFNTTTAVHNNSYQAGNESVFSPLGSPLQSPKLGRVADRRSLARLVDSMLHSQLDVTQPQQGGGSRGYLQAIPSALGQLKDGIQYFLAARPTPKLQQEETSKDHLLPEQVWEKLGLLEEQRFLAADRCQIWITRHVLRPLAQELDKVNHSLAAHRMSSRVGETGLSTLEKTNKADVPQLDRIMPYLRLHDNQYYLVARIRALAAQQGFAWSSGGKVTTAEGEPMDYKPEFPTDVEILFHCFCCYLDDPATLYIPSAQDVIASESRSFTTLHVVKTPDDANDLKKRPYESDVYLNMVKSKPPHFKLLVRVDNELQSWNIDAGRNNFFLAVVAMLQYVVKHQGGIMDNYADRALDQHGLNMLRVVQV